MHLVQNMVAECSERPANEQIRLVVERRLFLKRRWRGVAEDGTEFGFDLASRLKSGCVIHQTEQADYVVIQEPEAVYQIALRSPDQAALVGWKIGNLHFPVEITADAVRVTQDVAVRQLLERENWPYVEATVVFNPLRVMAHAS